ncbi:hypothetical protein E2978_06895 [Paracoccus yeei]
MPYRPAARVEARPIRPRRRIGKPYWAGAGVWGAPADVGAGAGSGTGAGIGSGAGSGAGAGSATGAAGSAVGSAAGSAGGSTGSAPKLFPLTSRSHASQTLRQPKGRSSSQLAANSATMPSTRASAAPRGARVRATETTAITTESAQSATPASSRRSIIGATLSLLNPLAPGLIPDRCDRSSVRRRARCAGCWSCPTG